MSRPSRDNATVLVISVTSRQTAHSVEPVDRPQHSSVLRTAESEPLLSNTLSLHHDLFLMAPIALLRLTDEVKSNSAYAEFVWIFSFAKLSPRKPGKLVIRLQDRLYLRTAWYSANRRVTHQGLHVSSILSFRT